MVRSKFTCFAVQFEEPPELLAREGHAMVVFANHVGWWDPIVAMLLRKAYFPSHTLFAPIDAKALEAYGIFRSLGFYGIQLDRLAGAAEFLKTSRALLEKPTNSIWITPEGTFTDCRDHNRPLMPGLAHLAADAPKAVFVPLAIEYPFWEEPRPMIAIRFGAGTCFSPDQNKKECEEILRNSLRRTQQELAQAVIGRDHSHFDYLIQPRSQRQGFYDTMRSWKAWMQGRPFDPSHRSVTTSRSHTTKS